MTPTAGAQEQSRFRPEEIPCHHRRGSKSCGHPKKLTVFTQGDAADAVFYVQQGRVRLTVVSKTGKEATLGILNEGDFFGEGGLAGQPLRMGSATAMTDANFCTLTKRQ